jgi:hypothetical protein
MSPAVSPRQSKSVPAAARSALRHSWTLALAALLGCEAEAPSTPMAAKASSADQAAAVTPAAATPAAATPAANAAPTDTDSAGTAPPAENATPAENAAPADNTAGTNGGGDQADGGQKLEIDNVSFTVPGGWVAKPIPPGGFIDAEFALPKAAGDDSDGRLTLSRAGGAVEANIDRWRGQFGGKPEKDEVKTLDVAGVKVTWVDLAGQFNDSRGPMSPPKMKPGYRMLAAIIPAGDFSVFVKATGPQKTLEAHAETLKKFVQSAKVGN